MSNAWCERTENPLLKVVEGRLIMGESVTMAKDTLKLPAQTTEVNVYLSCHFVFLEAHRIKIRQKKNGPTSFI